MSDSASLRDSGSGSADESVTLAVSAPRPRGDLLVGSAGTPVSRYVALEELGRGGMGRVLRAYDPKLQREVALKEVHRDRLDDEATARLVAEARAMAKLSHPHVVAVYDVEELETGEVVLVMEYVAGTTLKQWLREEDRSWRDIVARFVDAGRGLQAAQEAGLLHRDFKPANVLVSEGGVVKVTDFGIAKLRNSASSVSVSVELDHSADDLTEAGTVMGTPRYMAPEQHRGESLSPAADQYAYCVALWEALCRTPPFAGKGMAKAKATGPPAWPLSTTPRPIADAIVRGLAPKPEDRWPSINALLDALDWNPTRRRNRALLALGGIGAVGLAGFAYQGWADAQAQRCSGSEQQLAGIWDDDARAQVQSAFAAVGKTYADQAWTRAEAALDTYAQDWAAMHTEACEATTIRGEQSPEMMDLRMGCLHRAAVELRAAVEVLADADAEVVQKAHEVTGGLRSLSRCADTEALAAVTEPPAEHEAEAVEAAQIHLARASSLKEAGRYEAAYQEVEAAKAELSAVEYGPVQTEVAVREGYILERLGKYRESETKFNEAMRLASHWKQWGPLQRAAVGWIYVVGDSQRRMEDALSLRFVAQGLSQHDPKADADFHASLAAVLFAQGRYKEAEAEYRTAIPLLAAALGPQHPHVAATRNNLGAALYAQGRYNEAEAEYRTALAVQEAALGAEHPDVASTWNNLAAVLVGRGRYEEAEAKLRTALSVQKAALGPDHHAVAMTRNNLGMTLAAQRRYDEAEVELRAALALKEATLGPDHPDLPQSHTNLANVLRELDRLEEALPLAEAAWKSRRADDIPSELRAQSAFALAQILWTIEGPDRDRPRARDLAEDALASYKKAGDGDEEQLAEVEQWLQDHPLR